MEALFSSAYIKLRDKKWKKAPVNIQTEKVAML